MSEGVNECNECNYQITVFMMRVPEGFKFFKKLISIDMTKIKPEARRSTRKSCITFIFFHTHIKRNLKRICAKKKKQIENDKIPFKILIRKQTSNGKGPVKTLMRSNAGKIMI